ncbi:MAG: hypothetical protein WBO09_08795 [Methylocystis silviterrae]
MTDQFEARMADQVLDVVLGAREEVVDTDHVVAIGNKTVAQMRAKETRAASNENGFSFRHNLCSHDLLWLRTPRSKTQPIVSYQSGVEEVRLRATLTVKRSTALPAIQEVGRIATRLAQKRIRPEFVIVWSLWRRAHQADAKRAHVKSKLQLKC